MNEDANQIKTVRFSSEEFVNQLLTLGKETPCDETNSSFSSNDNLPPFYDAESFKRGQQFYHKNIFGMFFSKLCGLISILAIPSIRNVLIFTKMSGDPLTAYRRYLSTLFHMYVWYKSDFTPGSDLWRSITEVKNRHNSASKRHCKAGNSRITQMDMVLTQFGFMGYVLCRSKLVGIHQASKEELEDFVHLWRVIGYAMGIEERFNICRETVTETQEVCEILLEKSLKPNVERMDKDFIEMATYLVEGMWCMQPFLQINVFLKYILHLLNPNQSLLDNVNNNKNIELTKGQERHLWFVAGTISTMRFRILKTYHNVVMYITLWLMENFPFLAYYKFGKANSHVTILPQKHIGATD